MNALIQAFRNLSPSDRRALTILAVVTVVLGCAMTVMSVRKASASSARAATQAKADYAQVLELAETFVAAKAQKDALAMRIKRNRVQLETDIEAAARSLDIEIKDMKNQSPVPGRGDELVEERLRITIKAITMDRFAELMSKLLTGRNGDLIRVRELSLKTQFEDREKVKAVFVMSTWRRNQ